MSRYTCEAALVCEAALAWEAAVACEAALACEAELVCEAALVCETALVCIIVSSNKKQPNPCVVGIGGTSHSAKYVVPRCRLYTFEIGFPNIFVFHI